MARADPLAALRLRDVRTYAIGRIVAVFGAQTLDVAVGWQLYERTGSAFALGLTGLVQVVPVVLLALPAGAVADRFDRRRIATLAYGLLCICALGLAAISLLQGPTWAIYAMLVGTGLAGTFARPASSSLLAQLVPREHFVNANAWLSSGFQLGATAGPALGGLLIAATGGATAVYLLDAACALFFVGALAMLPPLQRAALAESAAPEREGRESLIAGLRFVFRTRVLLAAITLDLFAVLLGGATALLPIFAKDILRVGPSGLGILRASPSVGAFLTALVQTRLPPWKRTGRVLFACVAGFGAATVGFGLSRTFWLSALCLSLAGAFDNISVVIRSTLEQVVTPDRLRGRVAAIHWVFIGLSNEMGDFESGLLAALIGAVPAVVLGGAGTLLVVFASMLIWPEVVKLGPMDSLHPDGH